MPLHRGFSKWKHSRAMNLRVYSHRHSPRRVVHRKSLRCRYLQAYTNNKSLPKLGGSFLFYYCLFYFSVSLCCLINSRRKILPTVVFGNSSLNSKCVGTLYGASCSLQCALSSATDNSSPGFNTTQALTVSPRFGSGMPPTPTSSTFGCDAIASSTSRGHTWNPPGLINSFFLSTM